MEHLTQLILTVINFKQLIIFFNNIPVEITWLLFLFFCFISILVFLKLFGEVGLYIYTVIAIISANIQVLKIVEFSFFSTPIALGTILFSSTFLCTDILSEYYGKEKAKKNVVIGFVGFLLMTCISLFTLGFKPLSFGLIEESYLWTLEIENSLSTILLPMPSFFLSSMLAYLISQYFDIWLFSLLSKLTKHKHLWFRNNLSTLISSLLDNTIFSIFAFIIFSSAPLSINVVIFTYILGTYILRVIISVIDTPFIYIARYFIKDN